MTTVSFHTEEGGRIVSFEVKGHSGYAEAGSDIVWCRRYQRCASGGMLLNDVLGLGAAVNVSEKDAKIGFLFAGRTFRFRGQYPPDGPHGPDGLPDRTPR